MKDSEKTKEQLIEELEALRSEVAHTDITESKRSEAKLRESEERFRKAFKTMPEPYLITSYEDSEIVDTNMSFKKLLDYSNEEL